MIKLFDHGYVKLIESWGSDERIIESARMSTGGGFKGWGPICAACRCNVGYQDRQESCHLCGGALKPGDEKLLRHLWTNRHTTPFEMAGATFEVQAPIFVFREWHRHRTQSYSEMSARYAPLPDVNYVPSLERMMVGSDGKNHQAGTIKGAEQLTTDTAARWRAELRNLYEHAQSVYQRGLEWGVPKELARLVVPVGRYSCMRASANLLNWGRFLGLRDAPNAQLEIQGYAKAVRSLLEHCFPRTMALASEKAL